MVGSGHRHNRDSIGKPEARTGQVHSGKTVCIAMTASGGRSSRCRSGLQRAPLRILHALRAMLDIEERAEVKATYAVVGSFFRGQGEIERTRSLYRFSPRSNHNPTNDHLKACRNVTTDQRYRPPRSSIGAELRGRAWLFGTTSSGWASSASSLGFDFSPHPERVLRIPIHDDRLSTWHRGVIDFEQWDGEASTQSESGTLWR